MVKPLARRAVLSVAFLVLGVAGASAGVTRTTGPADLLTDSRRFVKFDAAHDTVHHVYLVAYGTQGPGPVNGILVNESGVALTGLFALSDGLMQSGWARVIYSPEQARFLVSYVKIVGNQHHQKAARFVTVNNNVPSLGPEMVLDDWIGDSGTATGMAYASASGKFLVTWSHYFVGAVGAPQVPNSFVSIIDPATGGFTTPRAISNPFDGQSDPEIACDPASRTCLVVGGAWGMGTGGKSSFWGRYIDDTSGAPVDAAGATYLVVWGGLMDPAAVAFTPANGGNPAQFLIGIGMGGIIKGMAGDGALKSYGTPFVMIQDATNTQGVGYGFLSMRSSPATGTVVATMTTWIGLAAVQELTSAGARVGNGFDLIPDTPDLPSKPYDTANQFAVPAVNVSTGAFAVFEDHYFLRIRVSTYNGGSTPVPIPPAATQPPVVTKNPGSVLVLNGATVTLTAAASGNPAPTVLWQVSRDNVNWQNISGGATAATNSSGTSTTLSQFVHRFDSGKLYRAVFTNSGGTTIGLPAQVFVAPPVRNDLNGDGRSELLVWRPSNNNWYWYSGSSTTNSLGLNGTPLGSPMSGDVGLTGDLDGDGAQDIIVWRPSTGNWFWLNSSNGFQIIGQLQFGGPGDVPIAADFDGDGICDLAVWRPSSGTWYWLRSSTGFTTMGSAQWGGSPGDVPLTADTDGDGKADLVIWRPSEGMWYILKSSSSYSFGGVRMVQWGSAGDQPLVGDFDGDGKDDLAIWRPSNGTWYWLTSSSGYSYSASGAVQWGVADAGDVPLLTDLDGDGRVDITLFRSSTGAWYWLSSSLNYSRSRASAVVFGGPGDIPIVR